MGINTHSLTHIQHAELLKWIRTVQGTEQHLIGPILNSMNWQSSTDFSGNIARLHQLKIWISE